MSNTSRSVKPSAEQHRKELQMQLKALDAIFVNAALGDFSQDVPLGNRKDELSPVYAGVQIMLNTIREKSLELETANKALSATIAELQLSKMKSEQQNIMLEAILDNIGHGLVVINDKGLVLMLNDAAEQISGRRLEEVKDRHWHEVCNLVTENGESIQEDIHPVTKAFRERTLIVEEHYFKRKSDNTLFPVRVVVAPFDSKDAFQGVVVTFRNIAEEKSIDQAKSDFVAFASHQLRTPLVAASWHAEMLLSGRLGPLTSKQEAYIRDIYENQQQMIMVTNTLLDVSKVEMGKLDIKVSEIDLADVIAKVLRELKYLTTQKSLTIIDRYSHPSVKVNTDARLIYMILHNIIFNAVKYTPNRGKITISTRKPSRRNGTKKRRKNQLQNIITVSDTGQGIPRSDHKYIFSKIYRSTKVSKKNIEGVGLGLYITKRLIEPLGGTVEFTSEEGEGSTFSIMLPRKKANDA